MKLLKTWPLIATCFGLLLLILSPQVHAGVGLEYLGPNPLRPQPVSGQPDTLGAGAIVGNTGDENATVTFTLLADQDFDNQFTYRVSDNNFSLSPSTRLNFAILFTYDPNTISIKDYSAAIKIIASPTSKSGTSGSASFNLPVAISANVLSSSYTGDEVTLTTSTGVQTMTSTTSPTTASSTASIPQINSLSSSSFSIDPNLLIGVAIGVIAILVVIFIFTRKRAIPATAPSGKSAKPTATRNASTKECVGCGASIKPNDRFCDSCGAKQGD